MKFKYGDIVTTTNEFFHPYTRFEVKEYASTNGPEYLVKTVLGPFDSFWLDEKELVLASISYFVPVESGIMIDINGEEV